MSSELKTQFLNYMTLQRFSDHTKRSYVTGVKLLNGRAESEKVADSAGCVVTHQW